MPSELPNGRLRSAVEAELARILQSPHFRTSRRSQQFLRYVVEHSLAEQVDRLKERAIGAALFDRPLDYDTGEDAAVRVAANEVRKRLAQYQVETPGTEVRIELPPGGYHAEFHVLEAPEPAPAPAPAPPLPRRPRIFPAAAALLIVAAMAIAAALLWPSGHSQSALGKFWAPLVGHARPILICLAHPTVYLLADPEMPPPANEPLSPTAAQLLQRGIIESADQYVGVGDAYAASQFAALFGQLQKPSEIRIGNDVSFSDLRTSPAVLIGAYSNRWSMRMNMEGRFSFARYSIIDRQQAERVWRLDDLRPGYRSNQDYLLVSRILRGDSGEPIALAAGITHAGTHAAAELLTRNDYLEAALRDAPADWPKRSFQLVLHCKVVGTTPGPPRLVASHFW